MIVTKVCANKACGRSFTDDREAKFILCPWCRRHHPTHFIADGCHHWHGAEADPRVTLERDANPMKSGMRVF